MSGYKRPIRPESSIDDLDLSVTAWNFVRKKLQVKTVGDLAALSGYEVYVCGSMNRRMFEETARAMDTCGLHFSDCNAAMYPTVEDYINALHRKKRFRGENEHRKDIAVLRCEKNRLLKFAAVKRSDARAMRILKKQFQAML